MKIKLFILLMSFSFAPTFGATKLPDLPRTGVDINELVPDGWRVLSSSVGDLNGDGTDDLAFAVQNNDPNNFEANEGLGTDSINLNPRILAIYFKSADSVYHKHLQSNEFILLRDSPTMDEPFDGLTIQDNGVLSIRFHFWYSAGSWYMSDHEYKFRYQNDHFELIGYESSSTHRGTMETTEHSINFLTKKMKVVATVLDEKAEEEQTTVQWKDFQLDQLKTIRSLKKPFEWSFEGVRI